MKEEYLEARCEQCIIRKLTSLGAINKDELRTLVEAKTSKRGKKGETIFREGENIRGIFCVRNGVSKLSKTSANGKEQILKLVAKGKILGQTSVFSKESANLSATALDDMDVCFIPKTSIKGILNRNPNFAFELLEQMANDLKEADNLIINMSHRTVRQRIATALLHLKNNFGEDSDGFLRLNLSREDMANLVGTATESCIRIISEFKQKGWLHTSGKKISISKTKKLQELVEDF